MRSSASSQSTSRPLIPPSASERSPDPIKKLLLKLHTAKTTTPITTMVGSILRNDVVLFMNMNEVDKSSIASTENRESTRTPARTVKPTTNHLNQWSQELARIAVARIQVPNIFG